MIVLHLGETGSEHFCLFHRLLQIRDDVFGIFQADAESEETLPIDFGITTKISSIS